jgi:hypothetical protein
MARSFCCTGSLASWLTPARKPDTTEVKQAAPPRDIGVRQHPDTYLASPRSIENRLHILVMKQPVGGG